MDEQIAARAGVKTEGKVIAHFLPKEVEDELARLEETYAKQLKITKIGKTVFSITASGQDNYRFSVADLKADIALTIHRPFNQLPTLPASKADAGSVGRHAAAIFLRMPQTAAEFLNELEKAGASAPRRAGQPEKPGRQGEDTRCAGRGRQTAGR